jgi:hypothetical protein
VKIQIESERFQLVAYLDQVLKASAKSVNTPDRDEIEFSTNGVFEKRIEGWTICTPFRVADSIVGVLPPAITSQCLTLATCRSSWRWFSVD